MGFVIIIDRWGIHHLSYYFMDKEKFMQEFQMLNETELADINGGFWPLVVVAGWTAEEAYRHSDQIAAGFKQGYKNGKGHR